MNWDLIIAAAIAALPPTLVAVLTWRAAIRAERTMNKVELNTNSMSERLGASALAQGRAEGRAEGSNERKQT